MSEKRPGRGADQFILRLPEGMRDKIRMASEANGRSMNAELVARIQQTLDDERWAKMNGNGDRTSLVGDHDVVERLEIEREKLEALSSKYALLFSKLEADQILQVAEKIDNFTNIINEARAEGISLDQIFSKEEKSK